MLRRKSSYRVQLSAKAYTVCVQISHKGEEVGQTLLDNALIEHEKQW